MAESNGKKKSFEERMEFLMHSIESHDRQIGELHDSIAQVRDAIAVLVSVTNEDATSIRTLARIAEAREARIANLEGGTQ
jgi:hypothetical protein